MVLMQVPGRGWGHSLLLCSPGLESLRTVGDTKRMQLFKFAWIRNGIMAGKPTEGMEALHCEAVKHVANKRFACRHYARANVLFSSAWTHWCTQLGLNRRHRQL